MAYNKIITTDGETLIDLTQDTVTPETLLEGATAHAKNGEVITGTATGGGGILKNKVITENGEYEPTVPTFTVGSTINFKDSYTAEEFETWGNNIGFNEENGAAVCVVTDIYYVGINKSSENNNYFLMLEVILDLENDIFEEYFYCLDYQTYSYIFRTGNITEENFTPGWYLRTMEGNGEDKKASTPSVILTNEEEVTAFSAVDYIFDIEPYDGWNKLIVQVDEPVTTELVARKNGVYEPNTAESEEIVVETIGKDDPVIYIEEAPYVKSKYSLPVDIDYDGDWPKSVSITINGVTTNLIDDGAYSPSGQNTSVAKGYTTYIRAVRYPDQYPYNNIEGFEPGIYLLNLPLIENYEEMDYSFMAKTKAFDAFSKVTVDVNIPEEPNLIEGTFTENGTYEADPVNGMQKKIEIIFDPSMTNGDGDFNGASLFKMDYNLPQDMTMEEWCNSLLLTLPQVGELSFQMVTFGASYVFVAGGELPAIFIINDVTDCESMLEFFGVSPNISNPGLYFLNVCSINPNTFTTATYSFLIETEPFDGWNKINIDVPTGGITWMSLQTAYDEAMTITTNYAIHNHDILFANCQYIYGQRGTSYVEENRPWKLDENINNVFILDGVEGIVDQSFSQCNNIRFISIPVSCTRIGLEAFVLCSSLAVIVYEGTIEQWNAITFGSGWNNGTGEYIIHCTDGDITKS